MQGGYRGVGRGGFAEPMTRRERRESGWTRRPIPVRSGCPGLEEDSLTGTTKREQQGWAGGARKKVVSSK
jgi:hypothetical protein